MAWRRRRRGQTVMQYALLVALITVLLVGPVKLVSTALINRLTNARDNGVTLKGLPANSIATSANKIYP